MSVGQTVEQTAKSLAGRAVAPIGGPRRRTRAAQPSSTSLSRSSSGSSSGSSSQSSKGESRQSKGEQTRKAILETAIRRFGQDGYRQTSVADIARDAGVSGTLAYAYFPNKEALFLAAVDEDAAAIIEKAIPPTGVLLADEDWQQLLLVTLVSNLEHHPLAHRLLAGLEPEATSRVLHTPALEGMRKVVAERIRQDQDTGAVRDDIEVDRMANGLVAIILSLLMSVVQLGSDHVLDFSDDVDTVLRAAFEPR